MILESLEGLSSEDRTGGSQSIEFHRGVSVVSEGTLKVLGWWDVFSSFAQANSPCTPGSCTVLLERELRASVDEPCVPPVLTKFVFVGLLDLSDVYLGSGSQDV